MARLFTSGFELGTTTAGVEFDSLTGSMITIQSTTKRTGGYAARCLADGGGGYALLDRRIPAAATGRTYYARFYLYVHTRPTSAASEVAFFDPSTLTGGVAIKLGTDGTVWMVSRLSGSQVGSSSSALTSDTWYMIETSYVYATGAVALKVNGSSVATGTIAASDPINRFIVAISSTTGGEYFIDDIAVNDDQGSYQNTWPGEGKVLTLRPSAAGDSAQWTRGGTDSGANWSQCNDIPPNNHTSYVSVSTVNYLDMYNVDSPGLAAGTTINVVEVGGRFARSASVSPGFKFRIIKAGSGTEALSAEITPDNTQPTYKTNTLASPYQSPIILYLDPDGSAWTPTTIDSMQIGVKEITDTNRTLYVSDIWAIVDYTPAATGRTGTVAGVCAQVTGAVSGDVAVAGEVAGTAAQVTGAVAGKVAVAGEIAATAAQATAAVAGTHVVAPREGTVAATTAPVTAALAGAVLISGTVAATTLQATAAVTVGNLVSGTVAAATGQATSAIAGTVLVSGTVGATCSAATASVEGIHAPVTGSIDADVAAVTGALAGTVLVTGEVAATAGATTGALAGTVLVSGEVAAIASQVTGAVDGAVGAGAITGTVAAVAAAVTAEVAGAVQVTGSIAATAAQTTGAAAGAVLVSGEIDANAQAVTAAVTGGAIVGATIDATLSPVTGAVAGAVAVAGTVDATISQVTASLVGGNVDVVRGSISANVAQIVAAIEGDVLVTGSVNATLATVSAAVGGTVSDAEGRLFIHLPGHEVIKHYQPRAQMRIIAP